MNVEHFKKYSINSIVRPAGDTNALKHQLGFFVSVLDALEIYFPDDENDPRRLIKDYVDDSIPIEKLADNAAAWWSIIDDREAVREFRDHKILMARLAICLLYWDETKRSDLGDNLSWFLELLHALNVDRKIPTDMMIKYFEYRSE